MYVLRSNQLPTSLDALPSREGYANRTTDGWNRSLLFQADGDEFSLTSLGRDGVVGRKDQDADIVRKFRVVGKKVVEAE